MDLVVGEFVLDFLRLKSPLSNQSIAANFLEKIHDNNDRVIISTPSPWIDKFLNYFNESQSEPGAKGRFKFFSKFFYDSEATILYNKDVISPIENQEISNRCPTELKYLMNLSIHTGAKLITHNEDPLIQIFPNSNPIEIITVNQYLNL